jgi:hypothetical protein
MVQLGIASYIVPETRRDIFSSDLEIGNGGAAAASDEYALVT